MSMIVNAFSKWYFNKLSSRLAKVGLTYHDAITESGVYKQALSRLPAEMQEARYRRIKRAIDLSSKHIDMPKELQEDPWREYAYVQRVMIATQKEKDEKATLNGKWWMPFHLGREPWYAYNTKNAYFWKGPEKKKVLGKA